MDGWFIVDVAANNAYIATQRDDTTSFTLGWSGYLYALHIYQINHDPGTNTTHASSCGACVTIAFNEYKDGADT
jgi:hypothetical protein